MCNGSSVVDDALETVGKAVSDVGNAGGDIVKATVKAGKDTVDFIGGENIRRQKAADKKALKAAKKAQSSMRKKKKEGEALAGARELAGKERGSSITKQGAKNKTGRRSTILTDKLGAVGGENNQGRKSLLGL